MTRQKFILLVIASPFAVLFGRRKQEKWTFEWSWIEVPVNTCFPVHHAYINYDDEAGFYAKFTQEAYGDRTYKA